MDSRNFISPPYARRPSLCSSSAIDDSTLYRGFWTLEIRGAEKAPDIRLQIFPHEHLSERDIAEAIHRQGAYTDEDWQYSRVADLPDRTTITNRGLIAKLLGNESMLTRYKSKLPSRGFANITLRIDPEVWPPQGELALNGASETLPRNLMEVLEGCGVNANNIGYFMLEKEAGGKVIKNALNQRSREPVRTGKVKKRPPRSHPTGQPVRALAPICF